MVSVIFIVYLIEVKSKKLSVILFITWLMLMPVLFYISNIIRRLSFVVQHFFN